MDIASFITSLPPWILFILLVVIGVLAAETGSWFSRRRVQKGVKEPEASIGSAVGAMLALLAFVLGFTFAFTEARYSDRKKLVIQQTNAIGTCFLRTSFIPNQQKMETRKLLREYVAILVQIKNSADAKKAISRLDAIHTSIWNQTASLAQEKMDITLRGLYVNSVNEVIDLAAERGTVALVFRIPGILWVSLLLLFALSMFTIGYQAGTYKSQRIVGMPLLAGAIALVIVLIADMDSPDSNRFRVSMQPMQDVQKLVQQNLP